MTKRNPRQTVTEFWQLIDLRDFSAAAALFEPGCAIDFVLSNERMPTPSDWLEVMEHYPGVWQATVRSIVADGPKVVTDTAVSDGTNMYIAISLFTIIGGKITALAEYWPEPYAAPDWRKQWTVPILETENGGSTR